MFALRPAGVEVVALDLDSFLCTATAAAAAAAGTVLQGADPKIAMAAAVPAETAVVVSVAAAGASLSLSATGQSLIRSSMSATAFCSAMNCCEVLSFRKSVASRAES